MKISYNWLQSFFKKKLPQPAKLADLLTMHSFETEAGVRVGKDYLLDVDVLPNRAHDCLSHQGIAREIGAITGVPSLFGKKPQQAKESKSLRVSDFLKVEVKDKNLCPRYTVRMAIDVDVKPSPKWIQERLKICGLKSVNNIVDIANYVMLETGQPLHAFDFDKIQGGILKVRRAKKGEKITTLDDENYDLDEDILVIADKENPVCIAGIKGGKSPEIDRKTKRIVLEAANFSPQITRQASKQLKLRTDASWRFENQIDVNLTEGAIDMAAYLIQKIAGGKVLNGLIDVYPKKVRPRKIGLDIEKVKSLLGVEISKKEIVRILESLSFKIQNPKSKILDVIVPTYRLDISIPEDLIEEIGRIYGFEKIPSRLPEASIIPPQRNEDLVYQNKIKDILVNLGFSEVYNYSFVDEKEIELYQTKPSLVEVANPVSQEQKYLRPSLILNLLKNVRENKKYFEEVRLFEIGRVFEKDKNKVIEKKKLGAVLFPADFYYLKGIIETLLNKLRISDVWYDDKLEKDNLKRAKVKVGNVLLGWLGDSIFELDFSKLVELATEERIYLPPSKYPAIIRDIALLVDPGTKIIEVLNLIHAAGGPLIKDIDLFDMYEGEEIPEGKKSLAFHIIYQSNDRTLTDKEINKLQEKIIKTLEEEKGWEVRR